jgi:hypothetical protein
MIYTRDAQVARKETFICVYDATAWAVAVFNGTDLEHPHIPPFKESYRHLLDALYKLMTQAIF